MDNPFNLADDFMEPYRFAVERHARKLDCTIALTVPARRRS